VLICKSANAGNEKFAGSLANEIGMESFQEPVALARGVSELKAKEGTRGIVNARIMPTLNACQ